MALEALKIKNFRFLLAADFFGFLGFNTRLMVQGWVVLELTNSDGWVGLVAGLPAIPVIALALLGGTITDRVNRRVVQMWTFSLLALSGFVLGLLISTEAIRLWHLIVIAFPVALLATLRMTAGSAMVIDVAGRELVFGANALNSAMTNLARFAGPGLGGWILATYGADVTFYAVGLALLVSTALMWFVKIDNPVPRASDNSIMEDYKLGIRYIAGTPELRWLAMLAISLIAAGMSFPLIPRWSRDVLGSGAEGYGLILAAGGVGGLIGAITLLASPQITRLARTLVIVAAIWAAAVIAFAFTSSLWAAAIVWAINGATIAWWANTIRTMFQLAAKDEMRGRVMSLFGIISQTLAFGWLIGGLASEAIGPRATFILSGLIVLSLYMLAYVRSPELRQIGQQD